MHVRIVLTGRNYDIAKSLPEQIELPDGATIDDALAVIGQHLPGAATLPPTCLVAVTGAHLGTVASHPHHALRDGDELMLIAPVAGG